MRCPYCVSEIADEALACPRCTRDLYLFKPLLEKLAQLEKTVAEQAKSAAAGAETRIAALEKDSTRSRSRWSGAIGRAAGAAGSGIRRSRCNPCR